MSQTATHHSNPTHAELIRAHLEKGRSITQLDALNLFGCMRLGARIHDLKCEGLFINKEMITLPGSGTKVARYSLVGTE